MFKKIQMLTLMITVWMIYRSYFSGAWIEGMYLGVKTLAKNTDKNVSVLLSEQMGILELLPSWN